MYNGLHLLLNIYLMINVARSYVCSSGGENAPKRILFDGSMN